MAKKEVLELVCDRCGRTEYLDLAKEKPLVGPDLVIQLLGETTIYEDLCSSCSKSVSNYVKQLKLEAKKKDDPPEESSSSTQPMRYDDLESGT